jgi:hypothetical protein
MLRKIIKGEIANPQYPNLAAFLSRYLVLLTRQVTKLTN